jgi:nucleotide-binding universal stress UspA family protein
MLVPFDGSAAAERVLRAACQAARREQTPLVVLGVVPIPAGRAADELPLSAADEVTRALLQAEQICRQEGVVAVFQETYATDLADEIIRVADRLHASVIALPLDYPDHGPTELMSPTVQRVLAQAHCTVMLSADAEPR